MGIEAVGLGLYFNWNTKGERCRKNFVRLPTKSGAPKLLGLAQLDHLQKFVYHACFAVFDLCERLLNYGWFWRLRRL